MSVASTEPVIGFGLSGALLRETPAQTAENPAIRIVSECQTLALARLSRHFRPENRVFTGPFKLKVLL
jgi:hypothetical protein